MLKKISKQGDMMSRKSLNSIRGGIIAPILCGFQCGSDCNCDEQIYASTGAFYDALGEIEAPI